ncbi:MAG: hypothetical protein LBE27_02520 [Deltaproteobacteria bacterium]|jgi:hypothetical protein|nr:hypothetical protein [Deltaproteobacteria bacterium]
MGKEEIDPPVYEEIVEDMEIDDEDWIIFNSLTNVKLSKDEVERAIMPDQVDEGEKDILAIHFHPEWVPMNLIEERLKNAFPNAKSRMVIPTQHNLIQGLDGYAGVEADVFAPDYNLKIQLLIHLQSKKLKKATKLKSMIEQTFQYRALQLLDYLEQIVNPDILMQKEIKKLGASLEVMEAAKFYAQKLRLMIGESVIASSKRAEMLKNRLLTDFILIKGAPVLAPPMMEKIMIYAKQVKNLVKARLNPNRFHHAKNLIEEARSHGAGIIIPHPPRFWPVMLDDLDVDGWEVWNSSTPDHTTFLIDCLTRRKKKKRDFLAFMGDDTHMSSKIRPDISTKKGSPKSEIGFQPPWEFPDVKNALKAANQSRKRTINEYLERIS